MGILFAALLIVLSIGGVIVGIQTPLWAQLVVAAVIILVLNSSTLRRYELGALPVMVAGTLFILGMLIGDATYLMQTRNLNVDMKHLFKAPS